MATVNMTTTTPETSSTKETETMRLPISTKTVLFPIDTDGDNKAVPGGLKQRQLSSLSYRWHTARHDVESRNAAALKELQRLEQALAEMKARLEVGATYSDDARRIVNRAMDLATKIAEFQSACQTVETLKSACEALDLTALENPTEDVRIDQEVLPHSRRTCESCSGDTMLRCPVCGKMRMCADCEVCGYCMTPMTVFSDCEEAVVSEWSIGTKSHPRISKPTQAIKGQLVYVLGMVSINSASGVSVSVLARKTRLGHDVVKKMLAKLREKKLAMYDREMDRWFLTQYGAEQVIGVES